MEARALPGFRDFYPDQTALKNHIFEAWHAVARRYGFEEYDGPPLEALELYTKKSGAEIVEQLYHFEDKGGRAVALRPEMTPTLARMVAARASGMKKPIRWFSAPQLFRYERQQRGRLREHFQLNMDIIGEPGPLADAEIIAAAVDVMRELGLGPDDVKVRVSDRRIMQALLGAAGVPPEGMAAALAAIDKIDRVEEGTLVGWLAEGGLEQRVAESILETGRIRGITAVRDAVQTAGDECHAEDLGICVDAVAAMGLDDFVAVDLSIVRGLDYYTGIVFEIFDAAKSLRAVCGGGRYDGLLHTLGSVDLPAVGFGMGDVVLGELLRERGWQPEERFRLDVFIVAVTMEDLSTVHRLAHTLRDRDVRVEYALKQQSITKQLKLATARPARFAATLGPEERAAGEIVVRDLQSGEDRRVPMHDLVHQIAG